MWGLGGHHHLGIAGWYGYKDTEVSDDPWCKVDGDSLVPDDLLMLWGEANILYTLYWKRSSQGYAIVPWDRYIGYIHGKVYSWQDSP